MESENVPQSRVLKEDKERAKAEKMAKKAELAAKKEQARAEKEALKHERGLKREQLEAEREKKRQQREAKRQCEEVKRQQDEAKRLKQKSLMAKFLSTMKPVVSPQSQASASSEPDGGSKHHVDAAHIDQQMGQELLLATDELLRTHLDNWKKARVKCGRWGRRQAPKIDIFKDLQLQRVGDSGAEPSTSQQSDPELTSQGGQAACRRIWKLLQFDKSHRPAYYGSFSKVSKVIAARHPLRKEPSLDYEVDSDEEWEEEEPGESLSVCDEEEEVDKLDGEDESGDDFVVPDGYLSENEGIQIDREQVSQQEHPTSTTLTPADESMDQLHRTLSSLTERALMSNTPYIICNFTPSASESSKTRESCLQALRILHLAEDISINPLSNDFVIAEDSPRPVKRQRRSTDAVDSLLPDIVEFLQKSPQSIKKTVEALSKRFPGVPKSHMETKIREISIYTDHQWKVKAEVLSLFEMPQANIGAALCSF